MKKLVIVAAQLNLLVGDIEGNAERIIKATQSAYQTHKADLVLFPELALTGYPPEDLLFRPALYERVNQALDHITKNIKHTTAIIGYPEKKENHYYNKVAVIQAGKVIANYAKQELPNYTVFDEKRYFTPGTTPLIINIQGVNVGVLICEDTWFDTTVKKTVDAGAKLIVSLNASPFAQDKSHARRNLITKQSRQFNTPIVYVNLVGGQDELVFDGGSMAADHTGDIVQQAAYFKEALMPVAFDLKALSIFNKEPTPPEPLDEEKIYSALVLGVRDYIQKNQFPSALIGLSGGVDSALMLAIAVDAIGSERVNAVMMPSRYTSSMSLEDAESEASALQVAYSIVDIEPIFKSFTAGLSKEFKHFDTDTTEENLQARIRGTLLMALSNKKGGIVLTTGNKSEMAVGYSTLYGDMVGGFAPLKDILKTMVYRLAHYRNSLSPVIPTRVLERAPSAELAPNQTDQDSLPDYVVLDDILERYIGLDQSPETICNAGFDQGLVRKVIKMINQNEYKRRQAPVGIRITHRAFGKDRRYPITSGYTKHL